MFSSRGSLLIALVLAPAAFASAHEPPKGIGLVWVDDASEAAPVIVANRGLVFADEGDGGMLFSLRCNEAYGANTADRPGVFLESSGTLTLGVYNHIYSTSDRACSVQSGSGLPDESLSRLVGVPGASNQLLVTTRTFQGDAGVFRSNDYGRTWSERFRNGAEQSYDALLTAPSDPQRLYAAGLRADRANQKIIYFCSVSLNAGATWEDHELPAKIIPFAVHPSEADVVFAYQPIDSLETQFRVLRSEDRGVNFAPVLEGIPLPTSLSASPGVLWLGVGGPGGLYRSADDGLHFERVHADSVQSVSCLVQRGARLWMCANMAPNTNGIWFSDDGGESFEKHMTFQEVTQAVVCEGEAQALCARAWYDFDTELHPPSADAGVEVDAGGVTPLSDAGGPSDGSASADATDSGADADSEPRKKRASGCQLGPSRPSQAGPWGLCLWLGCAGVVFARHRCHRRGLEAVSTAGVPK